MLVGELITRKFTSVPADTAIQHTAQIMRDLDVGMLPVIDMGGKPIGTVTDRDITIRATAEGRDKNGSVKGIMTHEVITCYNDQDVKDAVSMMTSHQIRRLVVTDRRNRPVGIVSLGDLAVHSGAERLSQEVLREVSRPVS